MNPFENFARSNNYSKMNSEQPKEKSLLESEITKLRKQKKDLEASQADKEEHLNKCHELKDVLEKAVKRDRNAQQNSSDKK